MTDWRPLAGPLAAHTARGDGPRVVLVHGFTQTSASWRPIGERLADDGHDVVIVDLPGHGGSGGVRADLRRAADMVAQVGGTATYVGYSLGGRVCLHLALAYPDLVTTLVLIGAHPGIADADARAERRRADDERAAHLLEVGIERFLDEWTAQPLFGAADFGPADRSQRLTNTADGLASSLRMAGTGEQTSLWPRLRELNMPVLALAGEHDRAYAAIAEQIAEAVPTGRWATIPGSHHAAHLQRPDEAYRLIRSMLPARD